MKVHATVIIVIISAAFAVSEEERGRKGRLIGLAVCLPKLVHCEEYTGQLEAQVARMVQEMNEILLDGRICVDDYNRMVERLEDKDRDLRDELGECRIKERILEEDEGERRLKRGVPPFAKTAFRAWANATRDSDEEEELARRFRRGAPSAVASEVAAQASEQAMQSLLDSWSEQLRDTSEYENFTTYGMKQKSSCCLNNA